MKLYIKSSKNLEISSNSELVEFLNTCVGKDIWIRINTTPRRFSSMDSVYTSTVQIVADTDKSYKVYKVASVYDKESHTVVADYDLSTSTTYTIRKESVRLVKPLRTYTTKEVFDKQVRLPDWD